MTRDYELVANGLLRYIIAQGSNTYGDKISIYRNKDAIERLFQASKEIMTCRGITNF